MKKLILILALTLTACTTSPKPYTEVRLSKADEIASVEKHGVYEETFSGANLLAKQGKELPSNQVREWQKTDLKLSTLRQERDFCHQYIPRCTTNDSWVCICEVYDDTKRFVAAFDGDFSYRDITQYQFSFYEGKRKLFSAPMEFGSDGPIQRVDLVEGKPAVSFRRALELPASDKELPKTTFDVFYNGTFFDEHFGVDGSHAVFTYRGKIGFIGRKGGKEYVYFDGKPVSKAFNVIRTSACCAAPMTELHVFDNGALVFVGERKGYGILTEIDLNTATNP